MHVWYFGRRIRNLSAIEKKRAGVGKIASLRVRVRPLWEFTCIVGSSGALLARLCWPFWRNSGKKEKVGPLECEDFWVGFLKKSAWRASRLDSLFCRRKKKKIKLAEKVAKHARTHYPQMLTINLTYVQLYSTIFSTKTKKTQNVKTKNSTNVFKMIVYHLVQSVQQCLCNDCVSFKAKTYVSCRSWKWIRNGLFSERC